MAKISLPVLTILIVMFSVNLGHGGDLMIIREGGSYHLMDQYNVTKGGDKPRILHIGVSAGFPYIFGLKFESILNRCEDKMPSLLITSDLGMTLGWYGSLILEKRLGHSPFYLGGGYNFTLITFGYGGGEVAGIAKEPVHSLLLAISARSSYQKHVSIGASLGLLFNPSISDWLPVLPALKLSLIRAN